MKAVLYPIRCIPAHSWELDKSIRRIELVIAIRIHDPKQNVWLKILLRAITMSDQVQRAVDKRYAL